MNQSYLLVTSGLEGLSGEVLSAVEVANNRLEKQEWAIYSRTKFKDKILTGDSVFIYVGHTSQKHDAYRYSIIAKADIVSIRQDRRMGNWFEMENYFVDMPHKILKLGNIKRFKNPFSIKSNLRKLDLVNGTTSNWGAYMQGGCKRLTAKDVKLFNGSI
jgi:hypothetical protein